MKFGWTPEQLDRQDWDTVWGILQVMPELAGAAPPAAVKMEADIDEDAWRALPGGTRRNIEKYLQREE